jgi:putative FmdB family regulatory protein
MPTYEYKCDACGHAFEQFQSMSSEPTRRCPKCKKLKVKRLIGTGAGLIFKGSGFYITDYRDQSYKDKAKADSGPTETKTEKSEGGDAAKPAAKSETPTEAKPAATESKKSESTDPKPASKESGKKKK